MIYRKRCIRCNIEVSIFDIHQAIDFEEYLLRKGVAVDETDILCDECVENVVDYSE